MMLRSAAVVGAGLVVGGACFAASVTLNAAAITGLGSSDQASHFRYRVSNTNWDTAVATSSAIGSGGVIVAQSDRGNHTALNGASFAFSVAYTAGSGYSYTMTRVSGGGSVGGVQTLAWTSPVGGVDPTRAFNAISLSTVVNAGMPSGIAAASMSVTGLSFSAAGVVGSGSLQDMLQSWARPSASGASAQQWIVADTDLSVVNWTLSGTVVGAFQYVQGATSPGGNIDERLKFEVTTWNAPIAVPLPGGAAMGMAGLGALAVRRRRA